MTTTELAAIMKATANSFRLGIFFWEQELRKWRTTEMADTKMEKQKFFEPGNIFWEQQLSKCKQTFDNRNG